MFCNPVTNDIYFRHFIDDAFRLFLFIFINFALFILVPIYFYYGYKLFFKKEK